VKRLLALLVLTACSTSTLGSPLVPDYERKQWRHWVDDDKDCQDTRQEVLVAESSGPVTYEDERECRVATGLWEDPYTGESFTSPSDLDVDHVVALRDAHDSGAFAWDAEKRRAFANELGDETHLRAVAKGANRSKGSRGPDEWLPPNEEFRCTYLQEVAAIRTRWELSTSSEEQAVLDYMVKVCNDGLTPPLPQR
jgi:hypothetical protein